MERTAGQASAPEDEGGKKNTLMVKVCGRLPDSCAHNRSQILKKLGMKRKNHNMEFLLGELSLLFLLNCQE